MCTFSFGKWFREAVVAQEYNTSWSRDAEVENSVMIRERSIRPKHW